ncbi:MAG: phosphoglucosamine mutase [Planctomycetota bacterium]|jgi:phosphoglucosamine mutase
MAGQSRLFGTDGVRGRAGEGDLEYGRVSALGRAIASMLDGPDAAVLVAHDGRRSGPDLAHALSRGLASHGVHCDSAGLLTTPGLAIATRTGTYAAGLMVSASHNPAEDNGIKIFNAQGEKLADEVEDRIQAALEADPAPQAEGPLPSPRHELAEEYLARLVESARGLDLSGRRVVIDCANGAGSQVGPELLRRLGAEVVALFDAPDGSNINAGCGSTAPDALMAAVREHSAHLGLALDGDGDRCLLVDEHGELVDGDALMALLALDLQTAGRLPGGRIVATVMSNVGLKRALAPAEVGIETVGVGDRRVVEGLREHALGLGGEQSGHIVFGPTSSPSDLWHFVGDGLYTGLRVLEAMLRAGRPLSELKSVFRAFPQLLINVRVSRKPPFEELPEVQASVAAAEAELGDGGRVLLRYSGTESLARVMVEGEDAAQIERLAEDIAARLRERIGA